MTNKYLEKASGIMSALGTYGKSLTGETVREVRRSVGAHKVISEAIRREPFAKYQTASKLKPNPDFHEAVNDNTFFRNKRFVNEQKINGMNKVKKSLKKEMPHTLDSDITRAEKQRNLTRGVTAGAVGLAGYSGASRRADQEKSASMTNKYLEKIAGFAGGGLGKRIATGAAIGGATGATAGGKENRVKGALAGAAAGGVAGSVFGRTMKPKTSHIFDAGTGPSRNAKLINPKQIA